MQCSKNAGGESTQVSRSTASRARCQFKELSVCQQDLVKFQKACFLPVNAWRSAVDSDKHFHYTFRNVCTEVPQPSKHLILTTYVVYAFRHPLEASVTTYLDQTNGEQFFPSLRATQAILPRVKERKEAAKVRSIS